MSTRGGPFTRSARATAATASAASAHPASSAPRGHYRNYSPAQLDRAVAAVRSKVLSEYAAEKTYHVPRTTLQRALRSLDASGHVDLRPSGAGHALTDSEESFLVDCFLSFADQDLPLTLDLARKLITGLWPSRRLHNGKRFVAGEKWLRDFVRRHHRELAFGRCVPLDHLHRVTPEMVTELQECYREFNDLVDRLGLTDDAVHSMDETKMSASASDAAHAKVIYRRGAKPYRRLKTLSTKATLVPLISASGAAAPPVVLHSQLKSVPRPQREAWNLSSHQPDTKHIPAGTSTTMTGYLFNECFAFWFDYLPVARPQVVLLDDYSAHYNPTTLLNMAHVGSSDPANHRLDGPGRVYAFFYPPSFTRFIAPPDHQASFGAFQRARRSALTKLSGAASLVQLMETGGRAYARAFKPANVRTAFQQRGFHTGPERFDTQRAIVASLLAHVNAAAWTDAVGAQHAIVRELAHPAAMGLDQQAPHRQHLGPGAKTVGVVNDDSNIAALVDELKRIQSGGKPHRQTKRQAQQQGREKRQKK